MEDPTHPADDLIETIKNTFSGAGFKQTLRDAWDRLHGPSAPSDHDKAIADMNKQANDQGVQDANKSFIKPSVAADIRKKAAK